MNENRPLIFGKHTIEDAENLRPRSINPVVNIFGPSEPRRPCRGCLHLYGCAGEGFKAVLKCRLRKIGRRDEHKSHWPACSKWEML